MAAPAAGGSTAALPPKPTTWAGQVAVITGGAQGLGFGIAEHLGSLGVRVCLLDLNEAQVAQAVAALKGKGIEASSAVIDVRNAEQWEGALKAFSAAHGRLDILVQAAGVTGKTGINTHEVDPANFDFVMGVNARGIFLGCKTVLPYMAERGYGRIVNIASVAGKDGNAGMVAYSASKGAVIAMTKAIGKEYAEQGITCNALAPAVVRTAMVDAMPEAQVKYMTGACLRGRAAMPLLRASPLSSRPLFFYLHTPPCTGRAADKIPMKRCGTIQEIASMVAFIVSPEASFTTGFTFVRGSACGRRAWRQLHSPELRPPHPFLPSLPPCLQDATGGRATY